MGGKGASVVVFVSVWSVYVSVSVWRLRAVCVRALKESEKVSRVNGFKQRRKGLFVGYTLDNLHTLCREELNKLRGHLNKYLKEIEIAEKNINEREIREIEKQITELNKQHEKV